MCFYFDKNLTEVLEAKESFPVYKLYTATFSKDSTSLKSYFLGSSHPGLERIGKGLVIVESPEVPLKTRDIPEKLQIFGRKAIVEGFHSYLLFPFVTTWKNMVEVHEKPRKIIELDLLLAGEVPKGAKFAISLRKGEVVSSRIITTSKIAACDIELLDTRRRERFGIDLSRLYLSDVYTDLFILMEGGIETLMKSNYKIRIYRKHL